jgi:hypothetical protein
MIKSAASIAVLALALAAPANAAGDAYPLGLNNWCGGWGCGWGGYGRRSFNQTIVVQAGDANQARLADTNYNERPPRAVPFDPDRRAGCDQVRGVYLCTVR